MKKNISEQEKIYNFLEGVFAELKKYQVFDLMGKIINNPLPLNCLLDSTHDPNEPEKIVMDYGKNVFVANCNGTLCIIGLGKPAGYSNRVSEKEIVPYPMNLVRIPLDIRLKYVTNVKLIEALVNASAKASVIFKGLDFSERFMLIKGRIDESFQEFFSRFMNDYSYHKGKLFGLSTGRKKLRIVKLRRRKIDFYKHVFRPQNMKNIVEYIINYN